MKLMLRQVLLLTVVCCCVSAIHGQDEVYVVTHIDTVRPPAATAPTPDELLKQFAAETRKEAGCIRFEVLQQADRANHFTVIGVFKDQKSYDEHEAATHTRKFREQIQPMLGSPFDERLHRRLQ